VAFSAGGDGVVNPHEPGVIDDGLVVARINASSRPTRWEATPWMLALAFGHHEDRTPTHGYESTREAAMAAFAKSWRRDTVDQSAGLTRRSQRMTARWKRGIIPPLHE
jgi:hypothetical protein